MTPHVSDLRWDRLLAGELSEVERAETVAHAEACPACASRRAEITAGFDAFANVTPALPRRWPRRVAAVATVAAAAAALVVVLRPPPGDETRTKGAGGPQLMLAAGPREHVAPVSSGDRVRPGDSVQAVYTATRDGFGAVLARDGRRSTATYVPAAGDAMVALPAGTQRSFPGSTILDEVTGPQVVVIVWCEVRRPLAPMLGELDATGSITAPAGCTVDRVELDVR